MQHQRKVPRKNIEKPIGILVQGHYHRVTMLQLGEGGLLFGDSEFVYRENDRLLVTFSITGESFILVRAVVKYRVEQNNTYGIEFEDLQFQNKREIRAFVASTQKQRPHLQLVKS